MKIKNTNNHIRKLYFEETDAENFIFIYITKQMGHVSMIFINFFFTFRTLSTSSSMNAEGGEGWLSKLLVRKIEPTKESHSRMLSDKEVIYSLHTHNIRTDSADKYLQN